MAKKIKTIFKLNLQAGAANPAPPVGPILGQQGVNIMEFCKAYNEKTKDQRGKVIPAEITVYEDRSFTFVLKLPPVSEMIKQAINLKKGTGTAGKEIVGTITKDQVKAIATEKMPDLNANDVDAAMKMVEGTARSMGVAIA
ncbi:MAG TPA: 50S ribosomal protein L11 [Patescibacteria group bacterium]|nr:50S ribosomal protein L11 [Patescibacteria group bacterium]